MKANKVTLTIKVEVLDIASAAYLVQQCVQQIQSEYQNGALTATDGDTVSWSTKTEPVTI